jgi:hypothetical protein
MCLAVAARNTRTVKTTPGLSSSRVVRRPRTRYAVALSKPQSDCLAPRTWFMVLRTPACGALLALRPRHVARRLRTRYGALLSDAIAADEVLSTSCFERRASCDERRACDVVPRSPLRMQGNVVRRESRGATLGLPGVAARLEEYEVAARRLPFFYIAPWTLSACFNRSLSSMGRPCAYTGQATVSEGFFGTWVGS